MAIIEILSTFNSNPLFPEIAASPIDFNRFGLVGRVNVSNTTPTSFSTSIGGSTPQTDRVTGEFTGTGLTYFTSIGQSGVILPIQISGTITSFKLSYRDLIFNGTSPGPVASQITDIRVSNITLPAENLNSADLSNILTKVNFGNDQIYGSVVDDIIDAGTGNDLAVGNDGNDIIYGGEGNDNLFGGNGNDQLFGDNGNDLLVGGAGNDWLVGGAGVDTLNGGDGDDGIVFDVTDNFASRDYDGGAGFDTLFFNADGPLVPFGLTAKGFEQAIGTRTDTTNQAWATNTLIYNAAWQLVSSEFVNDNGTKDLYRFDPNNGQNWNKIQSRYDSTGKLDYEITFYDDGSQKFLDFDLNNEAIWSSRILLTNAAGVITSDTFVADTILAQRSAENISKKVFVSDALI
jgi:hypothetical protein